MEEKKATITKARAVKLAVPNKSNHIELSTTTPEMVEHNLINLNRIAETIKKSLRDGSDYGVIPSLDKPCLFKPGMDKLALLFGLRQVPTILDKVHTKERKTIISYFYQMELIDGNGMTVATGHGLCSSEEKAYEDQNPLHKEHTILSVAKKRALGNAIVSLGVLSEIFTVNMEDNPLSTANANIAPIRKFDALALYSLLYSHFAIIELEFNSGDKDQDKTDFKDLLKQYLSMYLLPRLKLKSSPMSFNKKDKSDFIDYLNKPENKENDLNEIREFNKKQNSSNKGAEITSRANSAKSTISKRPNAKSKTKPKL